MVKIFWTIPRIFQNYAAIFGSREDIPAGGNCVSSKSFAFDVYGRSGCQSRKPLICHIKLLCIGEVLRELSKEVVANAESVLAR
jgi:hypothetical protein